MQASLTTRQAILRLWREHVLPRRSRLVALAVLTACAAGTTALYPVVIDRAFTLFANKDARILYQIPILVVIVSGAKASFQYAQVVALQTFVLLIIRDLQLRLFGRLVHADLARLEQEAPAQWGTRFTTDAAIIREALTRAMAGFGDAVTIIGLVVSMLWLDWLLSIIALVILPLAAFPVLYFGRRIRAASAAMQEQVGQTASLLVESFGLARVVRAFRQEGAEIGRANHAFALLTGALMRIHRSRARIDPMLEVLGGLAIAATIAFAGWRASTGAGSVGNFTGFVAALLIAARPLRALGALNASLQEGMAGLLRVFAQIDTRQAIADRSGAAPLPAGGGRIEFRDVRFAYADGRMGLAGLSFIAEPGRTVALVGPSGAGKSTALSLIPRLHDVGAGAVLVDEADVRHITLASLRGAIAYVGQDALLFDDTIEANLRLGRAGASEAELWAALDAASCAYVRDLPEGLLTLVGTGGGRLSGGQRQRLVLARALLRDPRILLLDEATSALDAESEAAVQSALAKLRAGRTTIVVAHRLATVRDADLIVVIEDGRAVEQGRHDALLARDGLYARLVRTQVLAA